MSNFMMWLSDNIGLALSAGVLLFGVMTLRSCVRSWKAAGKLERRTAPWLGFGGELVVLSIVGFGTLFSGTGLVKLGPGLLEQRRLADNPAPALGYQRVLDDVSGNLADHQGKVVLVNMWATWCPPCRAELGDLDKLQQTYGDDGLVVLQISDENRETLTAFLAEQPMSTEHGYVTAIPWPVPGRPTTYIVDREGVLRKSILGARSYEQFEDEVKKYL